MWTKYSFGDIAHLTTILCLLLILASYFYYEKKQEDKKWRNNLAEKTIHRVKNPYMVDDYFFKYYSNDFQAIINDTNDFDACNFEAYSFKDDVMNITDISQYLHRFDNKLLENKIVAINSQFIISQWIKQSELTPSIFNPFDESLNDKNADLSKQHQYQRFLECKEFFSDNKPDTAKDFPKKYHLTFYEKYKNGNFKKTYPKSLIKKVITDENSLVRIHLSCSITKVEFFSVKHKLFIYLQFNIQGHRMGGYKHSPNPACYSQSKTN